MTDYDDDSESMDSETPDLPQVASAPTVLGISQGAEASLAYFLGWISGLVLLVVERDNAYVRFHALQSVIVFGVLAVLGIVAGVIPFVGWMIALLLAPVGLIAWIGLMVKAFQDGPSGKPFKVPVLGEFAEKNLPKLPKT